MGQSDAAGALTSAFRISLTDLLGKGGAGAASAHGVASVEIVVSGGRYQRRRPAYLDVEDLLPWETIYTLYVDTMLQRFAPIRRVVLEGACVTGEGAVITRGGALLDESCWEYLRHGRGPHGLAREDSDHFRVTATPVRVVREPSLLLKRPWWRNYGHWLIDAAALLALVRKRGLEGFAQVVVGAAEAEKMRAIMRETVSAIAGAMPIIEHPDHEMWQFDALHYIQPVRRPPLFTSPAAVEALREILLRDVPPVPAGRRLFIARSEEARARALDNESDVLAVLEGHGFEPVHPERLKLREQAALFASAAAIAGVKGAGLVNALFLPQGTAVIALSPGDFSDPIFWDLAGIRGLAYAEIFGPLTSIGALPALNPFTIDPARLDSLLRSVLPARPALPPVATAESEYDRCMALMHARLRPRGYLAMGPGATATFRHACCPTIAVGPVAAARVVPPVLFLVPHAGEEFLETCETMALLGAPLDLAFIAGIDRFDSLLRAFVQTERCCHPGSMIVLGDCVPTNRALTEGGSEAWRVADLLLQHRPDLDVIALDVPPGGLVVIRNLDPGSRILHERMAEVTSATTAPGAFSRYLDALTVYASAAIERFDEFQGTLSR